MGYCLFLSSVAIACVALLIALLPSLMSIYLRHNLTAPGQEPWTKGRLRLINISGLPAQVLFSAERTKELNDSFMHKKDDVWVVSYVKSGTTWTIGILASLYDHEASNYSGNLQKTTRSFCPHPEVHDLGQGDANFGHSMKELNEWPSPRVFKSHWPSKDHVSYNGKSKFVYVMRNAQDQITSYWNQAWGMGWHYGTENVTFEGGWDGFVEDWLLGNVEMGKWFDHVASWYKRYNDTDVLFLRYEELKSDPHASIHRVAQFIGVNASHAKIEQVIQETSFQKMREADEKDLQLRFFRWLGVLRTKHIRQGDVGSGLLRFSEDQLKALEKEYVTKLQPLGMPRKWVLLE